MQDNDLISRQAAIDACLKGKTDGLPATNVACDCCAERIRVLPSAQSNTSNTLNALDCIDRQAVYKKDVLDLLSMMPPEEGITRASLIQSVKQLPSAEPAIPLSWIEAQIEWLKSLDNAFSNLTAAQISAMVNEWKDEQDDGCSQVFEREESDV